MRTCEFCNTSFRPRPQTKNPRACNNLSCQKARQAKNEREWPQRNKDLYSHAPDYHREKRVERNQLIKQIVEQLLEAIFSGFRFKGTSVELSVFGDFFSIFMHRAGIRKINKFYQAPNSQFNG